MPVRLVSHEEPLPGYRLIKRLGRGGFGEVWEVEAPGGLLKAMKFVFGDLDSMDEEGRPAEQELKALHRVKTIRHPYVLSLERFDIIDGQLIIVMELADRNMWDRFRECRARGLPGIPRDELLRYLEEAAEALDLMNGDYQIQHLDIKPQNLFLVHNHVKVADFGLAKLFAGDRGTITGGVTPVYAPPETFEGWVSRFSDQYSLAIVYQEMLTGTRPFNGANTKQLLLQHLNAPPDVHALPESDRYIIERALAKKPDERWPTCVEMIRLLRERVSEPFGHNHSKNLTNLASERTSPGHAEHGHGAGPSSPLDTKTQPMGRVPIVSPVPTKLAPGLSGDSGVVSNTPLPSLVTPRLVTQATARNGANPEMTIARGQIFQTARMNTLGFAPPERTGDGVLFPTLMIGVGQIGLKLLQTFRQLVHDRFGSVEALPTVRYLYIDTDADTLAAAAEGTGRMLRKELIHTPLQRPHHYTQESAAPSIDSWLPNGQLYRLPKNPTNADGVRLFGRLAFCDHYRVIAQRIRQEIETFLNDEVLNKTVFETGLGLRSNRPRAYLLSSLTGGTGSGMVIDLAYVIRHEFRSVGYGKSSVMGTFMVPPADKNTPRTVGLANAYATLAELRYYCVHHEYKTKFDAKEPPIHDTAAPFQRCSFLQLPRPSKAKEIALKFGLAAQGLALDILSPVGQVIDQVDAVVPLAPEAQTPLAHLFGAYRISWPRPELLHAATRRFSQRVLQRWAAKESTHLREPIQKWLEDQWTKLKLDPKDVVARFEKAAKDSIREDPQVVFHAAVSTLYSNIQAANGRIDVTALFEVLDQLLRLVGKPDADGEDIGSLELAIRDSLKAFSAEIETNLSATSVSFIEQPQYRLSGADEVLNQLTQQINTTVSELERVRDELAKSLRESYAKLFQLLGGLGVGSGLSVVVARRSSQAGELIESINTYPKMRYQLAILDAALTLYRGLLINIPEYLREVNFCRNRLNEMSLSIGAEVPTSGGIGPGVLIFPDGCSTIENLVDHLLSGLPPSAIVEFDQSLQKELTRKFRGLANVCLKPKRTTDFLLLLQAQAHAFLNEQFESIDPGTAFMKLRGDTPASAAIFAEAYSKANPDLQPVSAHEPLEATILATPTGTGGDAVRMIATKACPGAEFIPATLPTDIVIYREYPRVELTSLPQFGAAGREAFETQAATGQFPLSRSDIPWLPSEQ